jgi:hypothetical protein
LGHYAFVLVFLNNIAWVIAEALGSRKRIDQRLCVDSEKPLFQALVKEAVAGFGNDPVGHSIEINGCKVVDELFP